MNLSNFILAVLCDFTCAMSIVLCGKCALETSNFLLSLLWWLAVYFVLDLHVRLTNYLREIY